MPFVPKSRWLRFKSRLARRFADFWLGPNLSPAHIEDIIRDAAKSNGWEIDRLSMTREGSVYTAEVTLIPDEDPYRIVIHGNTGKILEVARGNEPRPFLK